MTNLTAKSSKVKLKLIIYVEHILVLKVSIAMANKSGKTRKVNGQPANVNPYLDYNGLLENHCRRKVIDLKVLKHSKCPTVVLGNNQNLQIGSQPYLLFFLL